VIFAEGLLDVSKRRVLPGAELGLSY
jgi:hypothetical protein